MPTQSGLTDKSRKNIINSGELLSNAIPTNSTVKYPCYRVNDNLIRLTIFVQPNASSDAVIGKHGDAIKIRLRAKPIDGEANHYLIKYLAKCFKIKKNQIKIQKGHTSRIKLLEIYANCKIPDNFLCR